MTWMYLSIAPCERSKSFEHEMRLTNDNNKFSKLDSNEARSLSSFILANNILDCIMNFMMYCKFLVVLYNKSSFELVQLMTKDSTSVSGALLFIAFLMCVWRTLINLLQMRNHMEKIAATADGVKILTHKLALQRKSRLCTSLTLTGNVDTSCPTRFRWDATDTWTPNCQTWADLRFLPEYWIMHPECPGDTWPLLPR